MASTSDDLVPVRWLADGATVWASHPMTYAEMAANPGQTWWWVRCVAVCVAGNHARIRNEKRGFERWVRLDDSLLDYGLRVQKGSPYAEHGEVIVRRSQMKVEP